jgi:dihydrofolate reductase
MQISLIAAMDRKRVIGRGNQLPWHLPADLKHFKALTMGKPILMGRKTYASIGKPLPGRVNIILTHDENFQAEGCIVAHSLAEAHSTAGKIEELMVIGGSQLFEQALPLAKCMYLTFIDSDIPGDTFFPAWDSTEWQEISREHHPADEKNAYAMAFVTLARI